MIGVGIVGCGLVGGKRARALAVDSGSRLIAVADVNRGRAEGLAADYPSCLATDDWRAVVTRDDVDLVIVSTTNDALVPVATAAVTRGKHVLVEKPGARSAAELLPLVTAAKDAGVLVKVGFNHRFHPAIRQARALFDEGAIGPLMYIRARYGHGGRLGYEREWRADLKISGGGELLDQGVHLIDLARWFAGDFTDVRGHAETYFWRMPVEDNAFLLLTTATGQVAWLHVSCTEWKNLFSFEIFGRGGKLQVDGLGGSYGLEQLTFYRMLPAMGPPETTVWEYPGEDESWGAEYRHLVTCLRGGQPLSGGLEDALAALEIVRQVYDRGADRAGRRWPDGRAT
jgi:predicted dehydrogenase